MIKGNIKMREWARTRLWLLISHIFIIPLLFWFISLYMILSVFSPTDNEEMENINPKKTSSNERSTINIGIHSVIGTATPQFGCDASYRTVEPKR